MRRGRVGWGSWLGRPPEIDGPQRLRTGRPRRPWQPPAQHRQYRTAAIRTKRTETAVLSSGVSVVEPGT